MQQWTWKDFAGSTPFNGDLWPLLNRRFRQLQVLAGTLVGLATGRRVADDGDASPSLTNIGGLTLANTTSTTIAAFKGGESGQTVVVLATDANTTIKNGSTIRLNNDADWTTKSGETRQFWTPDGVVWYEVPRALSSGDVFRLVTEAGDAITTEVPEYLLTD